METYTFQDDGRIPNHPYLPVLIYRSAVSEPGSMETLFSGNGWGNTWSNGVYPYHHYHSNTHEVLGVARGSAALQLGGESGEEVEISVGDILILPAGTGHKKLRASGDFLITGGYPGGADYNVLTGEQGERPRALEEISIVPLPGSLRRRWSTAPVMERGCQPPLAAASADGSRPSAPSRAFRG